MPFGANGSVFISSLFQKMLQIPVKITKNTIFMGLGLQLTLCRVSLTHKCTFHATVAEKNVSSCRSSHPHGSHYNPIMQQPTLLTLPSNQTLNVGVAHVVRQPSTNNSSSSKKSKQHPMSARYSVLPQPAFKHPPTSHLFSLTCL